ncbi:MAG: biotin/lipoyl-binding protein [Bacteroidetes bacterium]|nr:biotin/lipoyl-binding protein [Bacteroidota bacterium]
MDLKEIQTLIKFISSSKVDEVAIEQKDFKIRIKRNAQNVTATVPKPVAVQEVPIVCIIEAMKLFNEIESEVSGKIVKVLVDDSQPVEYGQPLFVIEPK